MRIFILVLFIMSALTIPVSAESLFFSYDIGSPSYDDSRDNYTQSEPVNVHYVSAGKCTYNAKTKEYFIKIKVFVYDSVNNIESYETYLADISYGPKTKRLSAKAEKLIAKQFDSMYKHQELNLTLFEGSDNKVKFIDIVGESIYDY